MLEKLKSSLQKLEPGREWTDEELDNLVHVAMLDASTFIDIKENSTVNDLSDELKEIILVGAEALGMRDIVVKKVTANSDFGEKGMSLNIDTDVALLAKQYNQKFEIFKDKLIEFKNK